MDVKWRQRPMRYFVNDRDVPGVTAADFRGAVARAAATWQARAGDIAVVRVPGDDGGNARPARRPQHPGVSRSPRSRSRARRHELAARRGHRRRSSKPTSSSTRGFPGRSRPPGEAGRVDLESVVPCTSSGICSAWAIPRSARRSERPPAGRRVVGVGRGDVPDCDDAGRHRRPRAAGRRHGRRRATSTAAGVRDDTGSIRGRVTQNGRGVFGAHVVAFNPETGALVGGFTLNDNGDFVIARLARGPVHPPRRAARRCGHGEFLVHARWTWTSAWPTPRGWPSCRGAGHLVPWRSRWCRNEGAAGVRVLAAVLVLCAARARARRSAAPPALRAHHVMVSGGVVWAGGYAIGDATATLRANALGASPPPFTLFETSSRVNRSPASRATWARPVLVPVD